MTPPKDDYGVTASPVGFPLPDESGERRTLEVNGGWLDGHRIRKARKAHTCDYFKGASNGGHCNKPIAAGAFYCEGLVNPDRAGGFGHFRYCAECAGPEAANAIARATGARS